VKGDSVRSRNRVKSKLQSGGVVHGLWLDIPSAEAIEIGGYLGFEYVVIDAEHAPIDRSEAQRLVRAAETTDVIPIVRVPTNDAALILGYLETGVLGIYVPHVVTALDARDIVSAVKFPPRGRRSAGSLRSASYGLLHAGSRWHDEADEDTMVIALIEDTEGIRNLGEILEVEGVDVIGIGDGDLGFSMGYRAARTEPAVVAAVKAAEKQITAAGRILDAVVTTPEEAAEAVSRGASMISVAVRNVLSNDLRSYLADVSQAT
jgi:2-keto-3-deoxy-L-rhamnonate aldolase RhmA